MHRVGYEPTIPLFERAKIFSALDRRANVIDRRVHMFHKYASLRISDTQPYKSYVPYLLTCGLLNDTVTSSGYMKSNDGQSANNWEGC
jgi:hypothetical protein